MAIDETDKQADNFIAGPAEIIPTKRSDSGENQGSTTKRLIRKTAEAIPALRSDIDATRAEIEKMKTQTEAGLRNRSLTFSFVTFTMLFASHIYFFARGMVLILPEPMNSIIWCMIVAPWIGYGMGRFVNLLTDRYGGKVEDRKSE